MKNKIKVSEHEIQNQILEYLRLKGYYCMRLNSGRYAVGGRYIAGQEAGTPDIMAFKKFYPILFAEVKKPGKKPTDLQKAKMEELRKFGAHCFVATCIEDLQKEGI